VDQFIGSQGSVSDGFESIVTREVHAKNGPVDFVSHACSDHNKRRVEAEDSNSDEEEGDSSSEEEEVIEEDLHHIVVVVERVKDEWEDKDYQIKLGFDQRWFCI
jgi:hypothetical protein